MAGLKDAKELPRSIMQTVAACSPGTGPLPLSALIDATVTVI
jgi:hypothetical protein